MEWKSLNDFQQLNEIIEQSHNAPQVIFKHSTRCSISHMAKSRLDKHEAPQAIPFYYLDLLQFRSLSNKVAEVFEIAHESPQILLIRNGVCIYDESHNGIDFSDIMEQVHRN